MNSLSIGRYIRAARLQQPDRNGISVAIGAEESDEVLILKQITRDYIISNPSLAAQQKGQERLLNTLFDQLYDNPSNPILHQNTCPTGSPIYGITHLTTPLASSPIASQA